MGSTTSSLASALATIGNTQTFSGVSTYSSDLQSILSRASQIAALPVKSLQNDQTTLKSKDAALVQLQAAVQSFASSLTSLGNLSSAGGALSASSDNSKVGVTVSGAGATAGTYTIGNVTSLATQSTATMTNAVADAAKTPVATSGDLAMYLVAGGSPVKIQLTSATNNLNGLRDAINASGAGVMASILTTTNGAYLTMTANQAGATNLQLQQSQSTPASNVMSMNVTGSLAQFEINGKASSSTSNQVIGAIPGVSLNLSSMLQSTDTATIRISASPAPAISALQTAVASYNALATQITTLGSAGAALAGSQELNSIRRLMSEFVFYQGSGSTASLTDLGVTSDKSGVLSVDSSVLNGMDSAGLSNALSFLGAGTTGLSAFATQLAGYSDSTSGYFQQELTNDNASQQKLQDQIDALNTRNATAQAALTQKIQAVDSLLASLQTQQNTLTASITGLNYTLYGKPAGSNG